MWLIEAKGMDVSQPLWLSGCPIKGHFRAKRAKDGKFVKIRTRSFGVTTYVGFDRIKKVCIYIFVFRFLIVFISQISYRIVFSK